MAQQNLLHIERWLNFRAADRNEFPDGTIDYWVRYGNIKDHLAREYFRNVDAGLAAKEGNLYTHHDLGHVTDVIRSAGRLLGADLIQPQDAGPRPELPIEKLGGYETYVLLVAILLHDAGNVSGRTGHEKRAHQILTDLGVIAGSDAAERRLIASIARAHGGKMPDSDKDTIGRVISEDVTRIQNIVVRPRLLAAALRMADELSENPTRANPRALDNLDRNTPDIVHNLYSKIIDVGIDVRGRQVSMSFDIDMAILPRTFNCDGRQMYLVDYIAERLEKCDAERQYCNRFYAPVVTYDRISAKLVVSRNEDVIDAVSVVLSDEGYPLTQKKVRDREPKFDGAQLLRACTEATSAQESL